MMYCPANDRSAAAPRGERFLHEHRPYREDPAECPHLQPFFLKSKSVAFRTLSKHGARGRGTHAAAVESPGNGGWPNGKKRRASEPSSSAPAETAAGAAKASAARPRCFGPKRCRATHLENKSQKEKTRREAEEDAKAAALASAKALLAQHTFHERLSAADKKARAEARKVIRACEKGRSRATSSGHKELGGSRSTEIHGARWAGVGVGWGVREVVLWVLR